MGDGSGKGKGNGWGHGWVPPQQGGQADPWAAAAAQASAGAAAAAAKASAAAAAQLESRKDVLCKFIKAGEPCPAPMGGNGQTTCVYSHNRQKFGLLLSKGAAQVAAAAAQAGKQVGSIAVLPARNFGSGPPGIGSYVVQVSKEPAENHFQSRREGTEPPGVSSAPPPGLDRESDLSHEVELSRSRATRRRTEFVVVAAKRYKKHHPEDKSKSVPPFFPRAQTAPEISRVNSAPSLSWRTNRAVRPGVMPRNTGVYGLAESELLSLCWRCKICGAGNDYWAHTKCRRCKTPVHAEREAEVVRPLARAV